MSPARSSTPRAPIAPLLHESLGERVYRTVRDLESEGLVNTVALDVLVNNAAVFSTLKPQPFDAIPEEAGRIVDVASAVVAKGTPFLLHYVASKGAVIAMTRALARELGDDGIAVNAVAPGLILSDTVRANPAVTGFQSAAVLQSRAFKRDAVPEDVEGAVLFLASSDSAFMTGQTLVVDGGSVFA